MSYTAPTYVDTKEQAVLALASTIADEDKSALGDGSVNRALDILADVLAEQDVQVPQTDAGAILALAQYVSGGGGGSATTDVYMWSISEDEQFIDAAFDKVLVQTGLNDLRQPVFEEVAFTPMTDTFLGATVHGAKVENVPCGSCIKAHLEGIGGATTTYNIGYGQNGGVEDVARPLFFANTLQGIALMPVDGFKCVCAVVAHGIA